MTLRALKKIICLSYSTSLGKTEYFTKSIVYIKTNLNYYTNNNELYTHTHTHTQTKYNYDKFKPNANYKV